MHSFDNFYFSCQLTIANLVQEGQHVPRPSYRFLILLDGHDHLAASKRGRKAWGRGCRKVSYRSKVAQCNQFSPMYLKKIGKLNAFGEEILADLVNLSKYFPIFPSPR